MSMPEIKTETPSQLKLKSVLIQALNPFVDNEEANRYIPAIDIQVDNSPKRKISELLKKVRELQRTQEPAEVKKLAEIVYGSGLADLLTNAGLPQPLIFKVLNQLAGLPVAHL